MKARIVTRDNGYFEIWERPDGTRVRVSTENDQYLRRTRKGYRAEQTRRTRERLTPSEGSK